MSRSASAEAVATEPATTVVAEAPRRKPGQKPGWMSIPGGPKEPDRQAFSAKIREFGDRKRALFDQLKEVQEKLHANGGNEAIAVERQALRDRLGELEKERRGQRDVLTAKNEEIAALRKQRREIQDKQKELSTELGGFKTVQEIDEAIDYIMLKMETGGGGLSSEKKTAKRLHQLGEAKNLLLQLQPLDEALSEFEEREFGLQQEYREIHERIGVINKEYEVQNDVRRKISDNIVDKKPLFERRDLIRKELDAVSVEMDTLRAAHRQAEEAWDKWRVEAQAKYAAKIKAEREEKLRRYLERRDASKLAEKRERAMKRMNPYASEIASCITLVQYLRDKRMMSQREEEERVKCEAAAKFDPARAAPSGFVMLGEDKWSSPHSAPKKGGKKQSAKAPSAKTTEAPVATKDRVLQHSEEKQQMFQAVRVDPPLALSAIDAAIKAIEERRKVMETHIVTGEPVLSSDDENEEENAEETNSPVANGDEKEEAEEAAPVLAAA